MLTAEPRAGVQILGAAEARMQAQEQRGVGARGAARLKAEKASKYSDPAGVSSGANMMKWSMG